MKPPKKSKRVAALRKREQAETNSEQEEGLKKDTN
jgi:hypothetical protein